MATLLNFIDTKMLKSSPTRVKFSTVIYPKSASPQKVKEFEKLGKKIENAYEWRENQSFV